jgi:hypothetical protein
MHVGTEDSVTAGGEESRRIEDRLVRPAAGPADDPDLEYEGAIALEAGSRISADPPNSVKPLVTSSLISIHSALEHAMNSSECSLLLKSSFVKILSLRTI